MLLSALDSLDLSLQAKHSLRFIVLWSQQAVWGICLRTLILYHRSKKVKESASVLRQGWGLRHARAGTAGVPALCSNTR